MVTIVMPAYNSELYIREAVDSILSQTYGDFELLVLDDCSTDETLNILHAYSDKRLKVFPSETKQGQANLINRGIAESKNELIAIAHSDDINLPERLERQVKFLDANPAVGVVGTFMHSFGTGREEIVMEVPVDAATATGDLLFYCSVAHPAVMFRKSLLLQNNIHYKQEFVPCEDYEIWTRLSAVTLISNIPYVGVKYRMHPNQISQTKAELTEMLDEKIRDKLMERVFPFLSTEEKKRIRILFDYTSSTKITPGDLQFFTRVNQELLAMGQQHQVWSEWLLGRLQKVMLASSAFKPGTVFKYLFSGLKGTKKIKLKQVAGMLYRSVFKST